MLLRLLNILKPEESFIPWLSPYFKGVDYTLRMANEAVAPLIIVVEGFAEIESIIVCGMDIYFLESVVLSVYIDGRIII